MYHWKVHCPLCEEIEGPPSSYFDNFVEKFCRKKMSSFAVVNEFKEKCNISNKIGHSKFKKDNFLIHVHCLQENMDVKK